jgi:hypothetical protein
VKRAKRNVATIDIDTRKRGGFPRARALAYRSVTGVSDPKLSSKYHDRIPFPGNIIPPGLIDPAAKKILEFFALPNQTGTSDGQQNYQNPTAVAFETYYTATGRVDHNLLAKHRVYGRFSWDYWQEEKDDRFDNIATGIFLNRKNRILGVDDAYTIRNNLLVSTALGTITAQNGLPRQLQICSEASKRVASFQFPVSSWQVTVQLAVLTGDWRHSPPGTLVKIDWHSDRVLRLRVAVARFG